MAEFEYLLGHLHLGKSLCSASSVSALGAWTVTSHLMPSRALGNLYITGITNLDEDSKHATKI